VRAEHGGDAPVQVPAHRHLLAGQLGVEVDDEGIGRPGERFEQLVDRRERVALDLQVHLTAQVDHRHSHSRCLDDGVAAAGIRRWKIGGADDPPLGVQIRIHLTVAVGVVAERDHVDPCLEDRLGRVRGYADAAGCVLAVRDDEIRHPLRPELRHRRRQALSAGLADDIPYEEEAHLVVPDPTGGGA